MKKDDIKKHSSNKSSKTRYCIEKILSRFMCEKCFNEKFDVMGYVHKDTDGVDRIILHCMSRTIATIEISRNEITLEIERETNTMIEIVRICIEFNQIILQLVQIENKNRMNIAVIISNDVILCDISTTTKDGHQEVTEYTEKIRYILLMNILCYITKICEKKLMKLIRKAKKINNKRRNKKS